LTSDAAAASGGNFANGAVTGAFAYAFGRMAERAREPDGRAFTENEAAAAKSEFPSLDVDKARVAYDMPGNAGFTPRNTIHAPSSLSACQDFITCSGGDYAGWFIHEAAHVWQYQSGVSPVWGHIFSRDIFTFGNYLPLSQYRTTPSSTGLSTERQADWHMWHYTCSNGGC